jgi:hypothetical protein
LVHLERLGNLIFGVERLVGIRGAGDWDGGGPISILRSKYCRESLAMLGLATGGIALARRQMAVRR